MIKIELSENNFLINNHSFKFPILIENLSKVLGEARRTVKKYNIIYSFDEHGIMAFSKNDKTFDGIMLFYIKEKFDTSPKNVFEGEFILAGEEARSLKKKNPQQLVKLFPEDDSGAVILNNMTAWFKLGDLDDGFIAGIEIRPYDGEDLTPKNLVPLEKEYKYLETLWMNWITAIEKRNPPPQKYFNLKSGIEAADIKNAKKIENFKIPQELIQFYQFRDVKYNPVSSLFQFSINGYVYYLIQFNKIKKSWEDIDDQQSDDESKGELEQGPFTEEIRTDNYANSKWIPIAEDFNGNYLLYDCDPGPKGSIGQIIQLQNESWERNLVAKSLKELIENQIIFLDCNN
ncbi:MAG: SMI1/KNR4 family protein [Bdellovibrionales bacterium]|nr:SMI1/KNR4 family protein [Bdellovibrionales bacterium]